MQEFFNTAMSRKVITELRTERETERKRERQRERQRDREKGGGDFRAIGHPKHYHRQQGTIRRPTRRRWYSSRSGVVNKLLSSLEWSPLLFLRKTVRAHRPPSSGEDPVLCGAYCATLVIGGRMKCNVGVKSTPHRGSGMNCNVGVKPPH